MRHTKSENNKINVIFILEKKLFQDDLIDVKMLIIRELGVEYMEILYYICNFSEI